MTAIPIAFHTNESKYNFLGTPRLINCYAEQQGKDAKGPLAVLPCPGLVEFAEPTDRPCRGTLFCTDLNCVYSVHSTSVYKTVESGVSTYIGIIPGADPVQMSRNLAVTPQIVIHCAAGEFYIEADVIKQVTDPDLIADVVTSTNVSGYTVYGGTTGEFQLSSINDASAVDGLDVASAEQNADGLLRAFSDRGELYLFGNLTIEQWRNTGQADFPFEPLGGSTIQRGLLAANSVASSDNTLFWPGNDNSVYRLAGAVGKRVSTHGIERTIENETSPADIVGFSWDNEGHAYYALSGTDWTRCYDSATQVWHSRESYSIGKWRAVFPFRAWGKNIFGDLLTGKLLALDKDTFTEDGDIMIWGMDSPTLHVFPNGAVVDALHIDVATGVGLTVGQGSMPKLMLSWSTDGGNVFKGDRELSLGTYGDRVRVTTRRLGRFGPQGIVFRLRISDPVIRAIVAIDVALRPIKK